MTDPVAGAATSAAANPPRARPANMCNEMTRVPFDVAAYVERVRKRHRCFICALVAGEPEVPHEVIYEDALHIAFLSRYPTVPGYTIVAPKAHLEHVARDLDESAYLRLMQVVRNVARAVEAVVPSERTYLLSLGSQQGNSHLHWHVAPLPPGTPYEQQQFHALMLENGVLDLPTAETARLGFEIRRQLTPG